MNKQILLIGAGPMAQAFVQVLKAQQRKFTVVGRGEENCRALHENTGVSAVAGGIESFCHNYDLRDYSDAIVAVGIEKLADVTSFLLEKGVRRLLVEKPAGLNSQEVKMLSEKAKAVCGKVFVAFNRRFYASTLALQQHVRSEGGVRSFFFEFTEWSHEIRRLNKCKGVKENWLLGNSSHVIDLAFHLGGLPAEMSCFSCGELDWHPKAVFAGSGRSQTGALFAYHANWDAPGRWGVEVLTSESRLYLRPLETLQIQKKGSVKVESVSISDNLDKEFKPGVFEQVRAFLNENDLQGSLCTLAEHAANMQIYESILSGKPLSQVE